MTDRAEPGVTPLTAAGRRLYDEQRIHNQAQRVRADDRHDERWLTAILAIEQEARALDAATPRPGLVEALREMTESEARAWDRHHRQECQERSCTLPHRLVEFYRDFVYCKPVAALASGTGEPGLDFFCTPRGHDLSDWCSVHGDIPPNRSIANHIGTDHGMTWDEYDFLGRMDARRRGETMDERWERERHIGIAAANDKGADR